MSSDNRKGRGDKGKSGGNNSRRRRIGLPEIEGLEDRRLLATWRPTSADIYDPTNGPMANLGASLVGIFREYNNYLAAGAQGAYSPASAKAIQFKGLTVGVDVRGTGDFTTFQQSLTALGMNITATSSAGKTVEGFIPVANLYRLATSAQINGAGPIFRPSTNFKGIGNNEGDQVLKSDAGRTAYGLDGSGQKIGVLSDSVNQLNPGVSATNPNGLGGLAQSQATGDLPANVTVIEDGPADGEDEGRAMLEQIYDIAPGAQLSFATAFNGQLDFADNIRTLAAQGNKTIVDDITYLDEAAFQDGFVTNAVNQVSAQGTTYLSSAANAGDGGYLSQFRGINSTVAGTAGRYMNFDPSGATQTPTLGVNVQNTQDLTKLLALQFDQPLNNVTSNVQLILLDSNNNVVASSVSNPFATNAAFALLVDASGNPYSPPSGLYKVAIRVVSGADPGHVFVYGFGGGDIAFDQSFGGGGGTYYESTFGHNSAANAISVGAVPFWGAPPFQSGPTYNEPYSSFGPVYNIYNFDGSLKSTPSLLLKPDLSAPDGVNTSFFIPGQFFDTSQFQIAQYLVYPGNTPRTFLTPKTPTNVAQPNLPIFTGTSSAAPNLAAVVVLMKQANPTATNAQILSALISSATPLNGQAKGVWNPQAGYGLADAAAALATISTLQVNSISPGLGQSITVTPTSILVTFSKPVNLATLSAGSLVVTGPNGTQVTVRAPVGVDSTTFPTQVRFPITITPAPGTIANGLYTLSVIPGMIKAQDGTTLSKGFTDTFNLQDTIAPRVTNTTYNGRIVSITFSEPLNAATVSPTSIILIRAGGLNNSFLTPAAVVVSRLPGATFNFNQITNTITIDLSGVPQSQLPTDQYALVADNSITDIVGNRLNGYFQGTFPSGVASPGVAGTQFVQNLGMVGVPAPVISSLVLATGTDTGIGGDSDTANNRPSFVGQVTAQFPNTNEGLTVYAQFNGIAHAGVPSGGLNLGLGAGGRGVVGQFDVVAVTNANGSFTINYPANLPALPEGQNIVRVVVVGGADAPPSAGLGATRDATVQVDRTLPFVAATYLGTPNSPVLASQNISLNNLSFLMIAVVDPVNPTSTTSPFAVSPLTKVPALNPATANNLANYRLTQIDSRGQFVDRSSFIKNANYVGGGPRPSSGSPLGGRIDLTFGTGIPQGNYFLSILPGGVTDAVGNALTNSPTASATGTPAAYTFSFSLQPTPVYITNYGAFTTDAALNPISGVTGVRANYEVNGTDGTPPPPNAFYFDFSNQLAASSAAALASQVIIARSANAGTANSDGDFGNFGTPDGLANPSGYTQVPTANVTVRLMNSVAGATAGQAGYLNRLVITVANGATATPDYYRIWLPNTGTRTITDVFGNQLDGEFLGYQNAAGKYVNKLNTGVIRGASGGDLADLSGDGIAGGAFVTGFVVVPQGNVIYARPDAIYNPQLPATYPDGSPTRPYPVLAPQATFTQTNGGDLNSVVNSGVNFNPIYDRAGLGSFQPSAFFAAQEKARLTQAPVVIIAQAALPTRDPFNPTAAPVQRPYVLQAPAGSDPVINDGSAAIPALTTLIFQPGTVLKMLNAALLVQNQGSALQVVGGTNPGQMVTVTSYKDSSIGGVTNGDASNLPQSGDYGGILFRNYRQAGFNTTDPTSVSARASLFPGQIQTTGQFATDGRLKGPFSNRTSRFSQVDAVSGADDVMSYVDFLEERYAGGSVPQNSGIGYDGITLKNSRPTIINSKISLAGAGSARAGISEDVDSLRLDDVASGPLFRNVALIGNGINGIYLRGIPATGIAQPTNATNVGTDLDSFRNGVGPSQQYILNAYIPYVLTTSLVFGVDALVESGGLTTFVNSNGGLVSDRAYISPGSIIKFSRGAGMEITPASSLNVGDTSYIRNFDANNAYGPGVAGFRPNSANLAKVIFTSYFDDVASTSYTDPNSGVTTAVTPALAVPANGSGAAQPSPTLVPDTSRWSGLTIGSGGVAVINSAVFRYGGGLLNTPQGTDTNQGSFNAHHALELSGGGLLSSNNGILPFHFYNGPEGANGARVMVTNSTFNYNADVGLDLDPQALLAADPLHPLTSGAPFIHGNIFENNDFDGVGVLGGTGIPVGGTHGANLNVNSTWTGSDFTYILRDTIVLGPNFTNGIPTYPSATTYVSTPVPNVTLTLQSTLPGTVLADGTVVAAPGVPLVIKTLNNGNSPIPTEAAGVSPAANLTSSWAGGAGFIVGVDDGTDPPTPGESLIDDGAFSQIRILGIAANASTGQTRVPVTITSIYDNSVGTLVGSTLVTKVANSGARAPLAGDGGIIYFGGNSLTNYNLQDYRSGSMIDNADLKFLTRVEQQGGGIAFLNDLNADNNYTPQFDSPYSTLYGTTPSTQFNSPKKLALTNSNFSSFSDVGFVAHPGYGIIGVNTYATDTLPRFGVSRFTAQNGEPTQTYLYNNTFSGMIGSTTGRNTAIEIISQTGNDFDNNGVASTATVAVILNNTFYNNAIGINSVGEVFNGNNPYSTVSLLGMNSIFSNNTIGVQASGQQRESNLQFNLYYNNGTDFAPTNSAFFNGNFNNGAYSGDPKFRDPANGNFNLTAGSAALDRSRSELGPSIFGNFINPAATLTQTTSRNGVTTFYDVNFLPIRNNTGDINSFGGLLRAVNGDILRYPGTQATIPDQWVPTLNSVGLPSGNTGPSIPVSAVGTSGTTPGTYGNGPTAGTYGYVAISGPRDQAGALRDKPTSTNQGGFGTSTFIDLGALEYVPLDPPVVTSVTTTSVAGANPTNLYVANQTVGTNANPTSISVGFDQRLNTNTLTPSSVLLIGSGGDGVFGNGNDLPYNLNNRLSFNSVTNTLVINTAGLLPTGRALNDVYRLTLKGTGPAIIRDTDGLALDGNTNNGTAPLPSGVDNFPGSDFNVSFSIDTNPPSLVFGSYNLAPGTFTTATATAGAAVAVYDITRTNTPTFVGKISDIFPPAMPLLGSSVFVDISTTGDPNNFDRIAAATGLTDVNGNFSVTVSQSLPDSNVNVGPDGKLGTTDDTGAFLARVRLVDQSGNTTLLPTSPFSAFLAQNAAIGFIVDTTSPQVQGISPSAGVQVTPNANGQVPIAVQFSENIDPASLNANSVQVFRAGGTGTFTGPGTPVPIVGGSFKINYLGGAKGPVLVTFNLQGPLTNDFYRIVLKGTGATPIRDIAGNPLNGTGSGTGGSDFTNSPFPVFSPANSRLIYVSGSNNFIDPTQTQGTRDNPFTTIQAGIAAAQTGDTVLVLPGTYRENIVMKGQIRLLSADPSSTNTFFIPGSPLGTIIYGNTSTSTTFNFRSGIVTVNASDIAAVPGVPTEISGFTILNPLLGDSVTGFIDTTSVGIALNNANVTVDKNYVINAGIGVSIASTGFGVVGSAINTNVIAGNYIGIQISDLNTGTTYATPVQVINNTIANNTYGLSNFTSRASTTQAFVLNDIFYNNHALTSARTGSGILSLSANSLVTVSNLFWSNGPNNLPSSNVNGQFGVFLNSSSLSTTPNAAGNFVGDPAFVAPRDPRPNGDTPAVFFRFGNYDLSSRSAAINLANPAFAPATDILYRLPVSIPGRSVFGSGPASIGAFYYLGTGGITPTYGTRFTTTTTTTTGAAASAPSGLVKAFSAGSTDADITMVGGSLPLGSTQFGVVNTSSNPDGASAGKQGIATSIPAPTAITVNFSGNVDPSTVEPTDLTITGLGLDAVNPAKATSLTWVDSHTVKFLLSGGFNTSGAVNLSIADGAIKDRQGDSIAAYAESFLLDSSAGSIAGPVSADPSTTPVTTTSPSSVAASAAPVQPVLLSAANIALTVQPVALAGPIAVNYAKTPLTKAQVAKAAALVAKKAHAAKVEAAKHAAAVKHAAVVQHAAAVKLAAAQAHAKRGKATK